MNSQTSSSVEPSGRKRSAISQNESPSTTSYSSTTVRFSRRDHAEATGVDGARTAEAAGISAPTTGTAPAGSRRSQPAPSFQGADHTSPSGPTAWSRFSSQISGQRPASPRMRWANVSIDSPRCTRPNPCGTGDSTTAGCSGVIELIVNGRGEANVAADTKLGASAVTAVSPAAIHRLRPANRANCGTHDRSALPRASKIGRENGQCQPEPQHPADDQQHTHRDRGDLRWRQVALEERLDLVARADRRDRMPRLQSCPRAGDQQRRNADEHDDQRSQGGEEASPRTRR